MVAEALQICTACGATTDEFGPGPNGRPNASCRRCKGLERHRFLTLLLELVAPRVLTGRGLLLDIAPSSTTTPRLRQLGGERYVSVDFDPAADKRVVDLRASLTQLPLPDDSVDLMVCYHVLEHVPDDASAMAEIARVVRPGGIAVVQVPHRAGRPTDEDPSAPVAERIRRFGQADHVRYYGDDFETRLEKAGLAVQRLRPGDIVPADLVALFRLAPDELVWFCHPSSHPGDGEPPVTVADVAAGWSEVLPVVMRRMAAAAEADRRELAELVERQRATAERWQRTYRRLSRRLPVRVLLRANRVRRRVVDAARGRSGQPTR